MGVEAATVAITVKHKGYPPFATEGKMGRCRGKACGQPVIFVQLPSGKRPPYDLDGTPHFVTCPDAAAFRKARANG